MALAALLSLTLVQTRSAAAPVATPPPVVTGFTVLTGPTGWDTALTKGGQSVQITGFNFKGVQQVTFGTAKATKVKVLSRTRIRVTAPKNRSGTFDIRVVTASGSSATSGATRIRYEPLSLSGTHLNGGLTAAQEKRISATFKARLSRLKVKLAPKSKRWTPAMGLSAARRAKLWIGLPYSWAGGTGTGPSRGVCDRSSAGIFDCQVWGFDCSGLALYSWGRYKPLVHYAATQYRQAGRFHPSLNELQPGDLLFYSSNGRASGIHHVVMYVGHGKVIQAPQSGSLVGISNLWVSDEYFGATRPTSTGRQGLRPTITSISTTSVPSAGGTKLIITGNRFDTASAVTIGTYRTYNFTVLSPGRIQVTVPPHAPARASVRVGNAWGISDKTSRTWVTYTAPPRPTPPPAPKPKPPAPSPTPTPTTSTSSPAPAPSPSTTEPTGTETSTSDAP